MKSRLRIGYILKRFPRASETFIAQEILELEARGVEVEIFTLGHNDRQAEHSWLESLAAPVTTCQPETLGATWDELHGYSSRQAAHEALSDAFGYPTARGRRYLAEAVAVARLVAERRVDHLHSHFANHPTFVNLLVHHLSGLPFSFTAHAKDIYSAGPPPHLWRRQLEEAEFAVAVAAETQRHLWSLVGSDYGHRVRLLHNGVDLDAIEVSPPADEAAREDLLCVARLIPKKGIDILLRALAILRDSGRPVRCRIVGYGEEQERLAALRSELGLAGLVELTGRLPHEVVIEEIARAAAVVLPARVAADGDRDALPTVLLEAMAAGRPCISSHVGGIPEIVQHGETGLLIRSGKPWELAEAIRKLLADPELRTRFGRAGRRRAEERFDRRRNVAQLHRWFEEVVSRRRQRGNREVVG